MSPPFRVGIGYDVHAFTEGRPLILGGITIPSAKGLSGHSDADVLLHAIMDAMLGAAGQPDIGQHFPNTDPQYKNISSLELLRRVRAIVATEGWRVGNIDASLVAEAPTIGPYVADMRQHIAQALDVELSAIGVKATTNERLGFVGRGEGIAAMAVALLMPASS